MSPATAEEGGYRFIGSAPHKMKLHRINVKYLVILEKKFQYICNCIHCPSSQNVLHTIVSTKFLGIQSSEKRRIPLMRLLALLHLKIE